MALKHKVLVVSVLAELLLWVVDAGVTSLSSTTTLLSIRRLRATLRPRSSMGRFREKAVPDRACPRACQELAAANRDLESETAERKQAEDSLKRSSKELRKTVNLMAGREVRMAELKEAICKLREQVESAGLKPVADDPLKETGKRKG